MFSFEFEFYTASGSAYELVPLSPTLLFSPSRVTVEGSDDCQEDAFSFTGHLGKVSAVCRANFRANFLIPRLFRASTVPSFHPSLACP